MGLDVLGAIPFVGELFDGKNALIYHARGDELNAGLSTASMVPFLGWGATGGKFLFKGAKAFTKSSTQLGQQMHKAYKAADVVDGVAWKEFRRIPGIRPDFVDFSTRTIYELKPFNPNAMWRGMDQLYKYQSIFQQKYGGTWNIVLDTY